MQASSIVYCKGCNRPASLPPASFLSPLFHSHYPGFDSGRSLHHHHRCSEGAACRPGLAKAESISLASNNLEGFKKRNSPPGQEMSGLLLLQDRSHCGRLFALSRPLHQLCNLSPAFPLRDARRWSGFLPSVARTCLWQEIHRLKWKQFICVRVTLCAL